jgi:hypothetical protein
MFHDSQEFNTIVKILFPEESVLGVSTPEVLTMFYVSTEDIEKQTKMLAILQALTKEYKAVLHAFDQETVPTDEFAYLQSRIPFQNLPQLFIFSPKKKFASINGTRTKEELVVAITNLLN